MANQQSNSSSRVRAWNGPAILTYGYRPFFLLAGAWAVVAMALWVAMLAGWVKLPTRFDPISWHAHEMLFGFLGAVIAGFLLTAVPNWTGRLPIIGWPLAGLVSTWVLGRLAVFGSEMLDPVLVSALDLVFFVVLAAVIGREILSDKNWRNLPMLVLLVLFATSNGLFHANAIQGEYAAGGLGFRAGLAVSVLLIVLIGGRVVPSFTRNWLAKRQSAKLPAQFAPLDRVVLAVTVIALVGWVTAPDNTLIAILCAVAGALNLIRLWRWQGVKALSEPLLWILHVGYLFVPLGFLAVAASAAGVGPVSQIGAQHVWMAGAIGIMPLAMMTRASLGHAGRPLTASRGVALIYYLVIASVVLRYTAALDAGPDWLLHASALGWIAGFGLFSILYWPILTKPRQ